ncbi:DUF3144 domain-containing protein [Uliginosibacterium sediminicola]|uniref:DUF3144 domain-containing protein n=1 Tax=Uliginosibacterium sediminicola TaxID=2024550 RepID=A0ABU9Z4N5_9RHOO
MQIPIDKEFFNRSNAYIQLANAQCDGKIAVALVNGSFMYGLSRFSAWSTAANHPSGESLRTHRQEEIDILVDQFRSMLEGHMDEHIADFDKLMAP